MLPDVKLAVRLQDIDNRVAEFTREISSLPKHIAEIAKKLESHERKLEADRAAVIANQRDRKRLEGEIQVQQQKVSKLRDQMLGAKTNDQYRAFQNEIEFCEKETRTSEDRILDLMSESEPLERNVKTAEGALKQEKAQVEAEKQETRQRTAGDQAELDKLQAERKSITEKMAPHVLKAYERVRKLRRGIAVAEAVDGRCSQCHMAMRLQFFQDLKHSGEVMHCESCSRILYYNPPETFENLTGETAPAARG
jgi:uncharacterized protein